MTRPQDLDEWSLAGLTHEEGLARWSGVFAGRPPASRMTVTTSWGWLAWEPADSEAAHLARLASRTHRRSWCRSPCVIRTRSVGGSRRYPRPTPSPPAPGAG